MPERSGAAELPETVDRRYRVLGRLGKGGGGEVLRVIDLLDQAELGDQAIPVALKRSFGDPYAVARARQEFLLLATLEHPALARAIDFGRSFNDQRPQEAYFTEELIEGPTLAALARSDPARAADPILLRAIALELADVLAYLHERNVLHLDLKPQNVLLSAGRKVRLIDLGVARVTHGAAWGGGVGTPGYLAPEVVEGAPSGTRSDVFALGATLYAAAEHQVPYRGRTRARSGSPEFKQSQLDLRDPELAALILSMIDRRPEARPLAHQLRAQLSPSGLAISLPGASFSGRAAELAELERWIEQQGPEPLLLLSGELGIGKSRLLRSLRQTLDARDRRILSASGEEGRVPSLSRLRAGLGAETAASIAAAWARAETPRPDLIIVDQAERAGSVLAGELSDCLRSADPPRVIVAVSSPIPAWLEPMLAAVPHRRMTLAPLGPEAIEVLIRSILGRSPQPDLLQAITAHSGGRPAAIIAGVQRARLDGVIQLGPTGWATG